MISAVDTNILLDILIPNPLWFERSLTTVESSASAGGLVICDTVYAELCCHFASQKDCDSFLDENEIQVESLSRHALYESARAWRAYRKAGGKRERILPDFMVGSHALHQASRLVSRDGGFYRTYFPNLQILDPSLS
ncbi:MAG: type II toxin-antitoxin system VapC family toxin [Acidobacteria bacterium]|nr:type II toxin-antitoxin system VapC family toxin [Acidobacteriota bacterium]